MAAHQHSLQSNVPVASPPLMYCQINDTPAARQLPRGTPADYYSKVPLPDRSVGWYYHALNPAPASGEIQC